MKFRTRLLFSALVLCCAALMWEGCTARRVPQGKKMVKRVMIINNVSTRKDSAKKYGSDIDQSEMYGYVRQKPNRKLFGLNMKNRLRFEKVVVDSTDSTHVKRRLKLEERGYYKTGAGYPLYLALYNLVDSVRLKEKQTKADLKFEARKEKRGKKGREFRRKHRRKLMGEILLNIGEPPVLLDTMMMHRTTQQLERYLDNKGYFRSDVRDSIGYPSLFKHHLLKKSPDSIGIFGRPKKKVIVYYIAKPAHVYTIQNIKWKVEDSTITQDIFADSADCLLQSGSNYDLDVFEAERDRIVNEMRNRGYFFFSRDFVIFRADTAVGDHRVNVSIRIKQDQIKTDDTTSVPVAHKKYYVRSISVKTIYKTEQLRKDEFTYDTLSSEGISFLRNTEREEKLRFRPRVLTERIYFRKDSLYRQAQFDETYAQLTSLRVFRQVLVDPAAVDSNKLDVQILLFSIPKQNFTAQVEGTNTGGYLGIGGSFAYQNNNLDRGAELLEFRIKGGTEAQQPLAQSTQTTAGDQLTFNTVEAGAELSLNIPRAYFPFSLLPIKKAEGRKTVLSTSFNYQRRVDFDRTLLNFSYGYTFKRGDWTRVGIYPFELNVVGVNPREGLEQLLANGDILLRYRFTDHLINDLRFSFIHNEQANNKKTEQHKWKPFLKFDAEMSGVGTYQLMNMLGAEPDTFGSYRIAGIPFSHYYRFFIDGRLYKDIGDHQMVVTRLAIGTGFPQKNFRTLPLEKSFYGGGANGIRAWQARSLGPGSLNVGADEQFAQFGEVQIEYNVELRFRLTKSLFGALFADGGNIWLLPSAPDAEEEAKFRFNSFYNDFAFGPGFGLRYDLNFFIVRLDLAFQMRDPSKPYGDRWWQFGDGPMPSNLNFGIGYPF